MKLSSRELKKVRAALPTGSYEEIARRTAIGVASVKGCLFHPERFNTLVIKTALIIIEEQKEIVNSLKNQIKDL